ncbi:MAG: hypothetical protein AAGC60_10880 [Acidobacteriota bacterium]
MASSVARRRRRRDDEPFGAEYSTITVRPSWGTLSIVTFLLAIPADAWTDWLPWQPENYWQRPLVPVLAIFVLSLVGIACALLGLRNADQRTAARIGLWLNGIALGVVLLTVFGIYAIFTLR